MTSNRHALTIIDGSGFIYRAFHALPPLTTPQGAAIGAVAGFISMMLKWHETHGPDYGVVVFDSGRSVSRHALFPNYKAHRPPTPPELLSQFPLIDEFCAHMNLPSVRCQGVEADDVIASVSHRLVRLGWQVDIVTSDKDLCQLAEPGVLLHDPLKKRSLTPDAVKELWGVPPDRIADVQALAGDSADGIPGIPGIGIKTATAWIQQFGSLEGVLTQAHCLPTPKKQSLVQEYADQARLCYQLAQLQYHHWNDQWMPERDWMWPTKQPRPDLVAWLDHHHLTALKQRLLNSGWVHPLASSQLLPSSELAPHDPNTTETDPLEISTNEHSSNLSPVETNESSALTSDSPAPSGHLFKHEPQRLSQRPFVLFHDPDQAVDLISASPSVAIYPHGDDIYVFWPPHHWSKGLGPEHWAPIWNENGCTKISHDVKALRHQPPFDAIQSDVVWDDIMLLSYALYGHTTAHNLENLWSVDKSHDEPSHKEKNRNSPFKDGTIPPEHVAAGIYDLWQNMIGLLDQRHVATAYYAADRPLVPVLARMEKQGVCIDVRGLAQLEETWTDQVHTLSDRIMTLAGCTFNPASPKQLGHVLFDQLGWPKSKKSRKTGSYVVDNDVLSSLAEQGYELASVLLEWRQLNKLLTTYVNGLKEHVTPDTQRIHTTFNMVTTSTGRLSSHAPNVQNIPIRTDRGRALRRLFVAPAGYVFLSLDYSQIELCLLAHMGPVASLQQAFVQHVDIHAQTAVDLFATRLDHVTDDQRRTAKSINFGILYGMSAFGLAHQLRLDRHEAKHLIDRYFHSYPEVKDYIQRTQEEACRHGFVRTWWGRTCWIPGANHTNAIVRAAATRQAVNAPLQGTSADIIKRAMILAHQWMNETSFDVSLVLQIHDELIFQVAQDHVPHVVGPLQSIMQSAAPGIPLRVNVTWGPTLDFDSNAQSAAPGDLPHTHSIPLE